MARLSRDQVMGYARAAGFTGTDLAVATSIAGWAGSPSPGESGGDPTAIGDIHLTTGKWGPSIGIWQIRSLVVERGTGGIRDELALYDPTHNAASAYQISGGGRDFSPWTVYTTGGHRANLGELLASGAASGSGSGNGRSATVTGGRSFDDPPGGSLLDTPGLGVAGYGGIPRFAEATANFVARLLDPEFWVKVGWVAGGAVLVGVGAAVLGVGTADQFVSVVRRGR